MRGEKFTGAIYYATWRGKGWMPCLWENRKVARENCDFSEQVIRVIVKPVAPKRLK